MSLILEGFMGCGKSAIGRRLADRLGLAFIDTDAEIERKQRCSISDIFRESGEEAFRQMETSQLYSLELEGSEAVISLGGGTPMRDANMRVLKRLGKIIYLKASPGILLGRLEEDKDGRPMLAGYELKKRVESLLEEREGRYLEIADSVVELSGADIDTECLKVIGAYEELK